MLVDRGDVNPDRLVIAVFRWVESALHLHLRLLVIAEQPLVVLLGVLLVLGLFFYLIYLGYQITKVTKDPYKKQLAFGLTTFLALQSIINIGVVLGLLPTKGISLPFISSGVSSLLCCLLCIGVLSRIAQDVEFSKNVT